MLVGVLAAHLLLGLWLRLEEVKDKDEHKQVVHRQRLLQQVASHKLGGRFRAPEVPQAPRKERSPPDESGSQLQPLLLVLLLMRLCTCDAGVRAGCMQGGQAAWAPVSPRCCARAGPLDQGGLPVKAGLPRPQTRICCCGMHVSS